jgi:hypothetical protein
MTYKYLYIDDAEKNIREPFANQLSNEYIQIDDVHVSEVILSDTEKIIELINKYDGLLLDLRLDETASEDEEKIKVPFTATVYAQHIRTLVTDGKISKDIPIVLFSTDDKLKKVYFVDLTSQDLFDRYIEKTKIPSNAISKLSSLANGYKIINDEKDIKTLIGLDNLDALDERIFARYGDISIPTHEYAQTILKDLIYSSGVLINELLLASRFGIDVKKSQDWELLKKYFEDTKYTGVFSDGWNRWWMHLIDDKFNSETNTYLSYLNANERVDLLKQITGLDKLFASEPIPENKSNRFWTYCKVLEKPLDPLEGFKINTPIEPKSWQEYDYCSLYAILRQKHKSKGITVHPTDREKLEILRSGY